MAKAFTENSFSSTYKDDFIDSDNYHRILFNSGRALQARELIQMQTIIQEEVARFGRNIFKDGAAVNPGGPSVNKEYEFVKLNTSTHTLPATPNDLVGQEFTGQTSGVKVRVLQVVEAENSDPDTIYVQYTSTSAASAGANPIRLSADEEISDGSTTLKVQKENTLANPAVGRGTQVSNAAGDFFTRGHFVFAKPQSIILSKYTTNPTADVGFKVTEDIVTTADDDALFDNQGATPNRSSPGADRYRIQLNLINLADADSDENVVFYCTVTEGEIVDQVTGTDDYNKINELLAQRTKEESGNYIVDPFEIDFGTDSLNDDLNVTISSGIAYVDGYRAERTDRKTLTIPKPRTTISVANEVAGINYGQYFEVSALKGDIRTDQMKQYNISTSTTDASASVIGTAHIRYIEEDGSNYKVYLFNIKMNSGQKLQDAKIIGDGSSNFVTIKLGAGSKAEIKDSLKQPLVFPLPRQRPRTITDIDFEVQRRFTATATGGSFTLSLGTSGETFVNSSQWIVINASSGAVVSSPTIGSMGTQSVTISGLSNVAHVVYAKVNKATPSIRQKTLVEDVTKTGSLITVGNETFLHLDKSDIVEIKEIKQTNSSGRDLTSEFTVDNGQRPGFYGPGRIVRNAGSSVTGTVYVKFNHLSHGAGDVFAINSYTGEVDYNKINGVEIAPRQVLNLRDGIDFRSSTTDSGLDFTASGSIINELPTNGDIFQGDTEYYVPRADKIAINIDGELEHLQGDPGFGRPMPQTPENTLPLFEIQHNAYGLNKDDLKTKILKYKRYTMHDINRIEERLDNLKEQVSLTQLEMETENLLVLDSSGIARTKSGILADNFKDKRLTDQFDPANRSNIAGLTRTLMPASYSDAIDLFYDSAKSSNVVKKGDNIYVNYTHQLAIKQDLVSGFENVNPFAVISGEGKLTLSPSSDYWVNTKFAPDNIINETVETDVGALDLGEFDRITAAGPANGFIGNIWGTELGQQILGGQFDIGAVEAPVIFDDFEINEPGEVAGFAGFWDGIIFNNVGVQINTVQSDREEEAIFEGTTRQGRQITHSFSKRVVVGESVSTQIIGDRRVDVVFLPFMRAKKIFFKAEGLRPDTRYFPFFDGIAVDDYCREETFQRMSDSDGTQAEKFKKSTSHPDGSSNLVSDTNGKIEGSFFLPSNDASGGLRFNAGSREFKLLDISNDDDTSALSRAQSTYTAKGQLETRVRDIVSTRTLEVQTQRWSEVQWVDPLAQSFKTPAGEGIFVSKVQAYFKSKDSKVAVQMQIRPMVNGSPSATNIVPGAVKFLNPSSVSLPASQTQAAVLAAPTTFEFDEPIYLKGNTEYCVVLLADSKEYNAYVGETYAFQLGSTEKRINRQPSMGSLFKSQNGTTWEPDQTKDLAFKLFRCKFDTAGGYATFENADVPVQPLRNNPFRANTSDNDQVRVLFANHGFQVGDSVTIAGATAFNGMAAGKLNGTHTITTVDGFGFTFDVTGDTFTSNGRGGGNAVTCTRQFQFDVVTPYFEMLTPEATTVTPKAKFTTGTSLAAVSGSQTRYVKDTTFDTNFINQDLNRFDAPRLVATSANETANLGAGERSVTWQLDVNTTKNNVAPVIDAQRVGFGFISNRIDKQAAAAANGYNVPYNYVAETNPLSGSHMAKHITIPVTLANPAVGLKILLAAIRPTEADFEVYYRTSTEGDNIFAQDWTLVNKQGNVAPDDRRFREYTYKVGNDNGDLPEFMQYQVKIVMMSNNSSKPPMFKDLRVIALAT